MLTRIMSDDVGRVFEVLFTKQGPLCERCLAVHVQMTPSQTAVTLGRLRQTFTVRVEDRKCPGCQQLTKVFSVGG